MSKKTFTVTKTRKRLAHYIFPEILSWPVLCFPFLSPSKVNFLRQIFNTFLGEGHRADLLIMGAAIHSLAREQM